MWVSNPLHSPSNELGITLFKNSKCAQCYFQASLLQRIREFPLLKTGKPNGLFAIAVDMEAYPPRRKNRLPCPVKHHTCPACCPIPWKCSKPRVHYRGKIDGGPNQKCSRLEPWPRTRTRYSKHAKQQLPSSYSAGLRTYLWSCKLCV